MWFKNDGACDGDPAQWQRESAEAGDPVVSGGIVFVMHAVCVVGIGFVMYVVYMI